VVSTNLREMRMKIGNEFKYSITPVIRTLVIRIESDRIGPSGKYVENSTKQTCLAITDYYRLKYSSVLWLIELSDQTRSRGLDAGTYCKCGPGSSVGIVTGYGLDGPGIESRWR
jgi:hypothetical protein